MLTTERDIFFELSEAKHKIVAVSNEGNVKRIHLGWECCSLDPNYSLSSCCVDAVLNLRLFRLQALEKSGATKSIMDSGQSCEYCPADLGFPEIRHFLYKSKTTAQFIGAKVWSLTHFFHFKGLVLMWADLVT